MFQVVAGLLPHSVLHGLHQRRGASLPKLQKLCGKILPVHPLIQTARKTLCVEFACKINIPVLSSPVLWSSFIELGFFLCDIQGDLMTWPYAARCGGEFVASLGKYCPPQKKGKDTLPWDETPGLNLYATGGDRDTCGVN